MTDDQAELIAYLRRSVEDCNAWDARFPDASPSAQLKAKLECWITQVSASVVISDEEAAALDREARVSQYLDGVAVIRSILARRGLPGQAVPDPRILYVLDTGGFREATDSEAQARAEWTHLETPKGTP